MNSENSEDRDVPPPTEEDLDSDVGTIFSDEEGCKELDDDDDDEVEEGVVVTDDDSDSSLSSDSDDGTEKCPICLNRFSDQEIGSPEMCEHQFCLRCITAWSKKVATCPVDRKFFSTILVKKQWNGDVVRIENVNFQNAPNNEEEYDSTPTYCESCGRCDREDRLLLCDGCDLGYHLECLDPPLEYVPIEDWFCPSCILQGRNLDEEEEETPDPVVRTTRSQNNIRIPRTLQAQRILESILTPEEEEEEASNSLIGIAPTRPAPKPRRKRATTKRKTTTRRTKRRSTATGTGSRRKRRSRRKTRRSRRRVAVDKRPNTARGRIAHHLGIMKPLPGQIYVGLPPACKGGGNSTANSSASTSTSINNLRYSAGITPLRMFGAANDLSDLVDSWSDEEGPVSLARMSSVHQPFGATLKGPPEVISTPESTNCDVLGLILKKQYILLHDKNIKIARDGTLVPSISSANLPANATTVEQKSPKNTATFTFPNQSSQSAPSTSRAVSTITTCGLTSNDESNNQRNNFNANQQQSAYDRGGNSNSIQDSSREAHQNTQGGGGLGSNSHSSTTTHSNNRQTNCQSDSVWEDEGAPDGDNDDEFDIYSDIEENPPDKAEASSKTDSTETNRSAIPAAVAIAFPSADGKTTEDCGDEHDSDQDNMVICEELEKSQNTSQQSETLTRNNAEPLHIETIASIEPQLPESPESIPLPDSPPPEIPDTEEEEEAPIVRQKGSGRPPPKEGKVVKPPPRQEYDPSEPLTSSDEDEHSKRNVERRVSKRKSSSPTKLSDMVSNTARRANPVKAYSPTKAQETKSRSQESSVGGADLSSIPIPPEEGRRPVIHFSIPTRHKLLPISSLMKRQKGVAKKDARSDGGGTINFQSEISKAFRNNATENDGTDKKDEHEEDENLPKISLVAEIFGSDEEDEEEEIAAAAIAAAPAVSNGQEISEEQNDEPPEQINKPVQAAIDTSSGLWKTLSAEPEPVLPPAPLVAAPISGIPPEAQNSGASQVANPLPPHGSEDEPEIIEIVTINTPAQPLQSRRFFGGHMRRELETISDSDSDIEVINMVNKEEPQQRTTPGKSKEPNKSRSKSRESSRSRSPDLKRRGRKRRFSGSSESHFEEGEIVDGNDGKKHKKEKKRKVKKQKPMRERLGKPPNETGDKNLSGLHSNISSEEDGKEEDKNVAWKKPSKRSQDANYRGAKGKSEHSLNRDKESDGSKSPANRRRGKGSVSPDRRAGAAYRRSHSRLSERFSRSHSRDSWNRNKRKRSRSGSSNSYDSPRTGQRRHHHRRSVSPSHRLGGVGHSRSPSKSPEPIRSRASHVSKGGKRSESAGSRGRDRTHRSKKVRKSTLSRSRSPASVSKAQKKTQKYSKSVDTHKKKKAKLKKGDLALTLKSKRRAKERLREKEKRKLAQKPKEEEKPATKIKSSKEKGEKKKRKREKSLSPVKAIVADGDSIVVSLSFQKETPAQSKASDKGTSGKETKSSKKSSKRSSETSKYKDSSSTRSPANSKQLDLGAEDLSSNSDESTHEREIGASKVSSSGDGSGRILGRYETEPLYNATADSSKVGTVQDEDGEPIQGDSLVTSTRDSLEPSVSTEEEYPNSATSPAHSKSSEPAKQLVQSVSSSAHSPRVPGGPSSGSSSAFTPQSQSQGSQSAAGSSSMQKSSAGSIGASELPSTQPQAAASAAASLPQSQTLRYPPPQTNMLTPVLATVATALLAVRQHNVDNNLAMLGDQMKNRSMMMMKNANARSQGKGNRSGGGDSPVSPNSSDGDDLFEPPTEHGSAKKGQGNRGQQKPPVVSNLFDSLFGAEPSNSASRQQQQQQQNKPPSKPKGPSRFGPPLGQKKVQRKESSGAPQSNSQNAQCDINVNEEMPASAVELSVQEKLLKKLNRQERVVEEVKLCLKPHYIKKHVTKDEYKEILRRAVPKVCHSKTGEINPNKIRELIEAYVRKFRHSRKKP